MNATALMPLIVATAIASTFICAVCAVVLVHHVSKINNLIVGLLDLAEEIVRLEHLKNVPSRQFAERVMHAHRNHP